MDKFVTKRKRVFEQSCSQSQPEIQSRPSPNVNLNNLQPQVVSSKNVGSTSEVEEINVDELESDPSLRKNIYDFEPNQVEKVRRAYLQRGPCQPPETHVFPQTLFGKDKRRFSQHQYPPESTKQELADKLGLTEKQVSGWFCHRRLKDRKGTNDETNPQTRQDRSSGVIQDRGSGLRQDSCGSTKQEDYIHSEPREVESKRLIKNNNNEKNIIIPHPDPTNKPPRQHDDDDDDSGTADDEDTSSGSTSPLPDLLPPPQSANRHVSMMTMTVTPVKRSGPSGYLKVKAKIENPAILAVKRQLGRNYCEDGPPLAVDFEPLPPDAFKEIVNKPQYVGEQIQLQPSEGSRTYKQPNLSIRDDKMSSHDSDYDAHSIKMKHSSYNHHNHKPYSSHKLKQNLPSSMEMNNDPQIYESNHYELKPKHGNRMRMDSLSSHHNRPYSGKITTVEKSLTVHREYFESKPSILRDEFLGSEDKVIPRRSVKGDFYGEKRGMRHYSDPLRVKTEPSNEIKVGKRLRDELPPHHQYEKKASTAEIPPWTNPIKRSAMEVPSSFSEDEMAETSSSGD